MARAAFCTFIGAFFVATSSASATQAIASVGSESVRNVAVSLAWASIRGQYGRVWPRLHPRYQRVTTREFWEACQRKMATERAGVEWLTIRATDAYPDRVKLPLVGTVSVTAVTLTARYELLGVTHTIADTNYWVKLDGRWRGLWDAETYRAYAAHRCPTP